MQKFIQFLSLILVIAINSNANNINKPVSSQYGFIENKGQIIDQNNNPNPSVLYLYNGNGLRVQLRKEGFSYEVINTIKTPKTIIDKEPHSKFTSVADSFDITYQTHRVDINFKDGNKNATLKPYQPASDFINYYTTGTSEAGVTNVHHFQKVVYENVYPNIDIEFVLNDAANKGKFKYNFIVKPNGNLADIKLAFLGANRTSLNQAGNILIETAYGNIEENIPLSYVINNNNSHSTIKANFITLDNNTYGINAENYNHNQTLVIDPTNWATYYGGSGGDVGNGITTDENGNLIIIGYGSSTNAMATAGAYQVTNGGSPDVFIAKFNTNGVRLWGTYYGGSGQDCSSGITTDSSGSIMITGYTFSSNAIATTGAYQMAFSGSPDVFIAKFNANGTRMWASYYGGSGDDYGYGITTDSGGNIMITGRTSSPNAIATTGSYQMTFSGTTDAFIAKFNASGNMLWATYYGGSTDDSGQGITSDASGNILITGNSLSTNAIATTSAYQTTKDGYADAFIVKFNTNGTRIWATYYGGSDWDYGYGITTDTSGNIILLGNTSSVTAIASIGANQIANGGGDDIFIAKFNANGTRIWATYYGGNGDDYGYGITTDSSGNLIITGKTNSANAIATTGSYQTTFNGNADAFIAKFNVNGTRTWATYFGGSGFDYGYGIATDANGDISIAGQTSSTNLISTMGAFQTIQGGGTFDAFIAKFNTNGTLPVKLLSFNATLANEKVNCAWETASEINNDYFTIERSKDGRSFEAFGNVKGQGNSNRNIRYSYTDNNPFSGISYYRLKQTDFDGKYAYSSIKKVGSTEKLATEISLYYENENPIVKINSLNESIVNMELINLNGIKLFTNEQPIIKGENTFAIDGNTTKGLYLLKVQVEDEVKYFKVWLK
jgi:predicted SpoU family rRNA methylase